MKSDVRNAWWQSRNAMLEEIEAIIAECNSGAYSALYAVERLTEVLGECNE
jgi:uncharacterized Fe-S cluster protein YjdI